SEPGASATGRLAPVADAPGSDRLGVRSRIRPAHPLYSAREGTVSPADGRQTMTTTRKRSAVGVFDPATAAWYLRNDAGPGAPDVEPFTYGRPGWLPVVGDWDGDGVTTVGAFDPSTATWHLRNRNGPGGPEVEPFTYGLPGWRPVAGDWCGTGRS